MSNCIYVEYDDCFEIRLLRINLRTARKEWVCGECSVVIRPGDSYEHARWLYDGQWEDHRTCARCLDVAEGFFRGRVFGMMVETFKEAHGFDYRDGIPADFTPCDAAEQP